MMNYKTALSGFIARDCKEYIEGLVKSANISYSRVCSVPSSVGFFEPGKYDIHFTCGVTVFLKHGRQYATKLVVDGTVDEYGTHFDIVFEDGDIIWANDANDAFEITEFKIACAY